MEIPADSADTPATPDDIPTYRQMFEEWVSENAWAARYTPLVFHLRKVCATLDAQHRDKGEATGPANTAYLQALTRLEAKRPGATPEPGGQQLDGQTSIFDEGFD